MSHSAPGSFIVRRAPALASADYRRLFFDAVFQNGANWALMMARAWLVFELSGSSTAVGIVTFGGMVPFLFASPLAGVLADRYDRRRLAIGAAAANMATSLLLAALALTGVVEVWHIATLAVLHGLARSVQIPAEQAMLPNLGPAEHLLNGVSLHSISLWGSRLLGPLVGAVILATLGAGIVFAISAGLLVGSLWNLARIEYRSAPVLDRAAVSAGAIGREFIDGVVHIGTDRRLGVVLALVVFHCTLTMSFDSMMPRLASDVGGGERTFSAILVGIGLGAVVATVAVSMLRVRLQGVALAVTGIGSGLAMVQMGLAYEPWSVTLAAALAGGTQAAYMTLSMALIQAATPDRLRARVMSLFLMLALGHMSFVNLGFGVWADFIGVRPLLIVPGLLWVAVFLAAPFVTAELRHLIRSGAFRPLPAPAATEA
jgi:MFS family permease